MSPNTVVRNSVMATAIAATVVIPGTSPNDNSQVDEGLTLKGQALASFATQLSYDLGGGVSIFDQRYDSSGVTPKYLEYVTPQLLLEVDVWASSKMVELLRQPMGSPIELDLEDALEIIRKAAGRRPDLPSGIEFVRELRPDLGYSIIERVKKQDE